MIKYVEALNYRCLKYVNQRLDSFQVLVGPNASGKTTFLDVIAFLGQLVDEGVEIAIEERANSFRDLIWKQKGTSFELAIELIIPEAKRHLLEREFEVVRYEVAIGIIESTNEVGILAEKVLLKSAASETMHPVQRLLFPTEPESPETIISDKGLKGTRTIVNKIYGGNDNYNDETGKGWNHRFKLGPKKSALGNIPDDETRFPVTTWLKKTLINGVQKLMLNSLYMRRPSPAGKSKSFKPDGSNLPWVIEDLYKNNLDRFNEWVGHLQTTFPELENVRTIEREEDKNRYIKACYRGNLEVPSWLLSDGTLRMFALTLLAYLPNLYGIYLIEEPENGIHPRAVETIFQSLSSVYNAQVLLASHSTVILSLAQPSNVLCFSKSKNGATDIVMGSSHPKLAAWKGSPNLGVIFGSGLLG